MAALSLLITDFLAYLKLRQRVSKATTRNYDHCLKRFLLVAGEVEPENIDLNLVKKYQLFLSRYIDPKTQKSLKTITQNYFLIVLRAFLKYLSSRNIQTLGVEKVELAKSERSSLQVLDKLKLKLLLQSPDLAKKAGLRDRAILEILFSTGLRVSELISLNRDTINLERGEFEVIGKGGKKRMIYISDSATSALDRYLMVRHDTFKPLFIRFQGIPDASSGGEAMRLTARSIERIVEKYVKKLRFPVKVTPCILRHSFATDLLRSGTDIRSVSEMLGHSNLSTTITLLSETGEYHRL